MEVNCVRVVFETSSGGFVVVVVVVEDFGLVLWCGWRMMELCGVGMRGGGLRFSLLVVGNMYVAVGACLLGIVI